MSTNIKLGSALLGVLLLAACSADPAKEKQKYFASGEQYFKHGDYAAAVIQFRNATQTDPQYAAAHDRLAQSYLALGNREMAMSEFQQTVSLDAANLDAKIQLAALLTGHKQFDQAEAMLKAVLTARPDSAPAHAALGAKYAATHDTAKADAELRKAIELDPRRLDYYVSLGILEIAAGRQADAEATYREAVERNRNSVEAHVSLGEFYFLEERKPADAEEELKTAVKLDPHAVIPQLLLARVSRAVGRIEDAERISSNLKQVAPDDPRAYQALGLFYLSTGQREKAAAEFQSLAASKPKDVSVKVHLAETLFDLKRVNDAATVCQQVLTTNPSNPRALLLHGRILIGQRNYQVAATELEKAVKADPQSADAFYYLGSAQRALGQLTLAKDSFNRAQGLRPAMTEAKVALANLAVNAGATGEATQLAAEAAKANPSSIGAQLTEARLLAARGDASGAIAFIEDALKRDPASVDALAILVKVYTQQGRAKDAVARISPLVAQHPQTSGLHFLLALSYFSMKDLAKAEASVKEAIRLDAKTPEAYTLLGSIDFRKGAIEQAKGDLRKAIDTNPQNVTNYLVLGTWYAKEGNWDETRKLWEKAHQVDPASPVVDGQLAFLYLEHGGDVNAALSLAQTAKRAWPDSGPASDTLGWAYYKLGSTALAVVELEHSVQVEPKNPIYLYHLGMAYKASGNSQSAKRYLQEALAQTPNFVYADKVRDALNSL